VVSPGGSEDGDEEVIEACGDRLELEMTSADAVLLCFDRKCGRERRMDDWVLYYLGYYPRDQSSPSMCVL
jgi:hypothetical protein